MDFNVLVGQRITDIRINDKNDTIHFFCEGGKEYEMYHQQECCESVSIEDINGDIYALIGNVIVQADEESNQEEDNRSVALASHTWTFYRMADDKGHYVVLRWYGESNGYYSEGVDFVELL